MIDPRVCSHYWDYTLDSKLKDGYMSSTIFADEWFGSANPIDKHHVVNQVRGQSRDWGFWE